MKKEFDVISRSFFCTYVPMLYIVYCPIAVAYYSS